MSNSFVDIKTFFTTDKDRTIENLSKVYKDDILLYKSIKSLMFSHLEPVNFKNKRVLLKPNLVKQNEHENDDICLFTHPNFILATVKVIVECAPQSIIIGDAPVQDSCWEKILPVDFYEEIDKISRSFDVPIRIIDFRKVVFNNNTNIFGNSSRKDNDYLIFDVGDKSWLEPITEKKNKFRVTNYDPARMKLSHSKGMHKYCIAKEVFDSDIVITIPKTKTHRISCITNSLKILVGINGDKDYLPHHRIGSKDQGGDCYKDFSVLRTLSESLMDYANHRKGSKYYILMKRIAHKLWRMSKPNAEITPIAGWYGNDTVWRMILDLNLIAEYGLADGTISDEPQRTIFTLCDGIVGGQGLGPMNPDPLELGIVSFSNDAYLMDEVMGYIYGLNIDKVPLLRESADLNREKNKEFVLNGEAANLDQIKALKISAVLAPGWVNYDK